MPTPPLPDDLVELLRKPNPAVIATLREDGHPVTVATWYLLDGDRVMVNMDATRKRLEHLRRDPRVSITVLDSDNWHTHVSLLGRVAEMVDDERLTEIDRLARHYVGSEYPDRESARVAAWIEVERYHGWGRAKTG